MNRPFFHRFRLTISPMTFLLLLSCGQEQEVVDLSLINMMYACEGPRYKIFRIGPILNGPEDVIDIKDNSLLEKQISNALAEAEGDKTDSERVLGRDVNLIFKTRELSEAFYKKEGLTPICNIYEIKGRLRNSELVVERFRIITRNGCLTGELAASDTQD